MAQTKNTNNVNDSSEEIEELRPIVITDNKTGEEYVLEFNAESVKFAENRNFNMDEIVEKPMTKIPELFFYAFRMHHKFLGKDKIDKIYDKLCPLPEGFVARLKDLYYVPITKMFEVSSGSKNEEMTVKM